MHAISYNAVPQYIKSVILIKFRHAFRFCCLNHNHHIWWNLSHDTFSQSIMLIRILWQSGLVLFHQLRWCGAKVSSGISVLHDCIFLDVFMKHFVKNEIVYGMKWCPWGMQLLAYCHWKYSTNFWQAENNSGINVPVYKITHFYTLRKKAVTPPNRVSFWWLFIFYLLIRFKGRVVGMVYVFFLCFVCTILFNVYFGKFLKTFIDIGEIVLYEHI